MVEYRPVSLKLFPLERGMDPQRRRFRRTVRKLLIQRFKDAKRNLEKHGIPVPTR